MCPICGKPVDESGYEWTTYYHAGFENRWGEMIYAPEEMTLHTACDLLMQRATPIAHDWAQTVLIAKELMS